MSELVSLPFAEHLTTEKVLALLSSRRFQLMTLLVYALFLNREGVRVPSGNELVYLLYVYKAWHPHFMAGDWTFLEPTAGHGFFNFASGWLTLLMPLEWAAWAGRFICWTLTFIGLFRLGEHFRISSWKIWLGILFWMMQRQALRQPRGRSGSSDHLKPNARPISASFSRSMQLCDANASTPMMKRIIARCKGSSSSPACSRACPFRFIPLWACGVGLQSVGRSCGTLDFDAHSCSALRGTGCAAGFDLVSAADYRPARDHGRRIPIPRHNSPAALPGSVRNGQTLRCLALTHAALRRLVSVAARRTNRRDDFSVPAGVGHVLYLWVRRAGTGSI